jgi:hypothetical protein
MTNFLDKKTRDDIGIDSYERAILLSALLLKSALLEGDGLYKNNVTMVIEDKTLTPIDPENPDTFLSNLEKVITINVKFPYKATDFLSSGGDYLQYIESLSSVTPKYLGSKLTPSPTPLNIVESPLVDNLETFLAWLIATYLRLLQGYYDIYWATVGYSSLFDASDNSAFTARISLPIDYAKYTQTSNILESLKQTVLSVELVSLKSVENNNPLDGLQYWDLWLFGDDFILHDDYGQLISQQNNVNTQVGIPDNYTLTIQNNHVDSGKFELFLLTNEDITNGWKVLDYTINNQQYGTIYTATQSEPNKVILQIPESTDIQGYLYLYKNKITGTFASSQYSEDTSFSGTIPVSYKLLHKDKDGKLTTITKNISLVVLPQNDFIANISPEEEQEILELATEKQAHFDLQVYKSFTVNKSIVSGKFLKNQGFTVLSWTINNTEYTNFTEVNFSDYKFNSNGNKFILTRYSQNATVIKLILEIQQNLDNLVGGYEGEIATVEITLNFAYLAVTANDNLIENDPLIINTQAIALADLQNQKANLSLFTIDNYFSVPSLIYQWDYQKTKNLSVQSISDNYGCFEGLIRLETPEARVFFSVFNNKGFEICKVPDKNYIFECSTSPNNSISNVLNYNFEIKAPNNFPNWNNGLIATKNADLDDDLLSKYNYQGEQRIDYKTVNLNVQDLHFALTWSPNGANFEVKFYLNGMYQNSLIIPNIPTFKIASFNRYELAQYTEQIWLNWTQNQTADFKNYVKRVNNNQIVGSVSDNLAINNALVANNITTNNKRIIGYVNSNYGIPYTYYNQTGYNEIFYTIKKKETDWFLIKALKLSNTMRYTANFEPTATYLV